LFQNTTTQSQTFRITELASKTEKKMLPGSDKDFSPGDSSREGINFGSIPWTYTGGDPKRKNTRREKTFSNLG